jgi:effector-binding domain-containing protein
VFIIGIDPHKGSHTAVAIDGDERIVGELLVRADRRQRERLLCWAAEFEPRLWAVEGATGTGFGPILNKTFQVLVPRVLEHLQRSDARPGMMVGWYEEPRDDGSVVAHVGFDIGDQAVVSGDGVSVVTLPVVEVASVVHHGSMADVVPVYEALVQWIEDSGYRLAGRSRELYREYCEDDHSRNVTELQMPIAP